MTQGQIETAERKAMNEFDRWNSIAGCVAPDSGYYYEMQGVIEDAVHIGIQMALFGEVKYDKEGNVVKI